MDQSGGPPKTSRLPRPSKLPVPQAAPASRIQSRIPKVFSPPKPELATSNRRASGASAIKSTSSSATARRVSGRTFGSTNNVNKTSNIQESSENDDALFKKPFAMPSLRQRNGSIDTPSHDRTAALQEIPDLNEEATVDQSLPPDSVDEDTPKATRSRKGRPSLSERTMETLSQIPPSPSPRRRRSSIYGNASPMRSASAMSNYSRPGSSLDSYGQSPAPNFRQPSFSSRYARPDDSLQALQPDSTPSKRRVSSNFSQPKFSNYGRAELGSRRTSGVKGLRDNVETLPLEKASEPRLSTGYAGASKTLPTRPRKGRPSLSSFLEETPPSSIKIPRAAPTFGGSTRNAAPKTPKVPPSKVIQPRSVAGAARPTNQGNLEKISPSPSSKSSSSLRQAIAQQKAARRKATGQEASGATQSQPPIATGVLDHESHKDPFDQDRALEGNSGLLRARIEKSRTTGRLDIGALNLSEIPLEVMTMFSSESMESSGVPWFEVVDLVYLAAANNKFETFDPEVFPDVDPDAYKDEDDSGGNQFGGIQTLDFHGNSLSSVPLGLRRLDVLSKLNLSDNKLGNECVQVIAQCRSLKSLSLGSNKLFGQILEDLMCLESLENLDVHDNELTIIPDSIRSLKSLRVLNVTGNHIETVPFQSLEETLLSDLQASRNAISGVLLLSSAGQLTKMKVLNVAHNQLEIFSEASLSSVSELQQLDISFNRIKSLGDFSPLKHLVSVQAEDNQINALPSGFAELSEVKTANFSGNNIRTIDERVGLMEKLNILDISRNPLKERRFLGMTLPDLKRQLRARIDQEQIAGSSEAQKEAQFDLASGTTTEQKGWVLKQGTTLDRSSTSLQELTPSDMESIVERQNTRSVELRHNNLTVIPSCLTMIGASLRTLDLQHNKIAGDDYLRSQLSLPKLQTLDLSRNSITSISTLLDYLLAPSLLELNVQCNRVSSIPTLRDAFPRLRVLKASTNEITEVSPLSLDGLEEIDLQGNQIIRLPPKLGELRSIKLLEVRGNPFRVPSHIVLSKGTEALMTWLRDKIPE
ncbi:MAG: hypothetical protein M4579_005602 [Chaenotheca gracillima]|nr:MAG: hypothetical protein M4579_005602 [Chaenotheca gracillima]